MTASPRPRASKPIVAATALAPSPRNLFAGTSGWAYPTWKPGFYPADIPSRAFLHFYAAHLTSVEVNYTFRALPTATQLQGWLDSTPPGFRFSFKAPQRITHFQRLRSGPELGNNSHEPVSNSHESKNNAPNTLAEFLRALTPAHAANKLGPLLFQLPPNFAADNARLAAFLEAFHTTATPIFPTGTSLQIAFEFRHTSWFAEATYAILKHHNAALCVAEGDDLVTPDISTANFRCYRLRRSGGYTKTELNTFAQRFTELANSHELFVYFRHEDEPTGALNAKTFLAACASKVGARA